MSIQITLSRLWRSWGVNPPAVIGHSLGEYTALQMSGVLSISDAILLVGHRARLLETRCQPYTHSMLAASEKSAVLRPRLSAFSEDVEVACSNSPRETVFAGRREVIDELVVQLSGAKIPRTKLQVPFAFHAAQVDPVLDDLEEAAKAINFGVPQICILSSFLGRPLELDHRIDANYIRQHCRHTVQFASAVETSQDQGLVNEASVLIEIGPHPIFLGMIRGVLGDTPSQGSIGMDSLMASTFVGRIRDESDIDYSHSQFLEFSTSLNFLVSNREYVVSHTVGSDTMTTDPPSDRHLPTVRPHLRGLL